jgi:organic hydroperoxide reductase OsmC/OhrA
MSNYTFTTAIRHTRDETGHADRDSFMIASAGKTPIACSSDPVFHGDGTKHNPEELLIASVAACHMLWYLYLCRAVGISVAEYCDKPVAELTITKEGGRLTKLVLNPKVRILSRSMAPKAMALHDEAGKHCFLANSLNIEVSCNAVVHY